MGKCLAIDSQKRFASAAQLLHSIEAWQGPAAGTRVIVVATTWPPYAKWIAAAVVVLIASLWLVRVKLLSRPAGPHAPVMLLVADFDNKTGDSVFDGTLEPMLGIALEGAPFISSFNRGQAKKIALQLQPGATRMDTTVSRLVANREGIDFVVGGSIGQEAGGYRVYASAVDPTTGQSIVTEQKTAANKQDVLAVTGKLAEGIRKGLGDTKPTSAQKSAAETFTTASLEAAHAYAVGQGFQLAAKWDDALKAYARAVELDSDLGRAYAGMAAIYDNLGKRQEAENYYCLALKHIDRMTQHEKYRTRSGYYLLMRDEFRAMQELNALVSEYPADIAGHANLALAYFLSRNMSKALEEQKRALAISPRSVLQQVNYSMYALYAGDFDSAAKQEQSILQDNPKFEQALRTLALANLGLGHNEEACLDYTKLEAVSTYGASIAANGLADLALYEGRVADAATILQRAISADLAAKEAEAAADRLATLALVQMTLGRNTEPVAAAAKAAAGSKDLGVVYRAAQVYIPAGQETRALQLVAPLAQRLEVEPQVYAKLIAGEAQLKKGNARDALSTFQEAQKLADTWLGHDMGRAYLDLSHFPEADSEFDVCLKRRGEATAIFLDAVPSYHALPPVYYYQGRAREGLGSPGAAESYKAFLSIKEKGAGDPLVADAQRRISGH